MGVTIYLRGELGAGKTTIVQGLGMGLGLKDTITSPTFALEHRFGKTLLHIDLYRLNPREALRIVEESEDFPGIRVIEWSERLGGTGAKKNIMLRPSIHITFHETSPTGRILEVVFADIALPDRATIEKWRKEVRLPEHIAIHCDAVGAFAKKLAEEFIQRSRVARPQALDIAGQLHDLFRFVDFVPGMNRHIPNAEETDRETEALWRELAKRCRGGHEAACARFLEDRGYPSLASIIRPHGLLSIDHPEELQTTEQKLLFYADKRIMFDQIVSLDERFDDFAKRYGNGVEGEKAKRWRRKTKELERELFGDEGTIILR